MYEPNRLCCDGSLLADEASGDDPLNFVSHPGGSLHLLAASTVVKLVAEHDRINQRIEAMYVDKLDGRITTAFYDEKATQWRQEQAKLQARCGFRSKWGTDSI